MNKIFQTIRWLVYATLLILVISAIMLTRPKTGILHGATNLVTRFEQSGIPVNSVQILQQSPLQVEIVLQSSSNDDSATQDDLWYRFLASRQASLAYLTGDRIDSYRLVLINSKGEIISSEWFFLDATIPSQNLVIPGSAAIGETQTRDLLLEKLNTFGMKLISLNIMTDKVVLENTRLVEVHLSISSNENASNRINAFIMSLRPILRDLNENHGTQIAVFRLKVTDLEEVLLTEYILDLERSAETWSLAKGIEGNWFPRPAPTFSPNLTSQATSTPLTQPETYPPPATLPYP